MNETIIKKGLILPEGIDNTPTIDTFLVIDSIGKVGSRTLNDLSTELVIEKSQISDFVESDYLHTTGNEIKSGNLTLNNTLTVSGVLYANNSIETPALYGAPLKIGHPLGGGGYADGDIQIAGEYGQDFQISYTRGGTARWKQKFENQTMTWLNNTNNIVYYANNQGQVAIGSNTPSAKLDITGDTKISDSLYVGVNNFKLVPNLGKVASPSEASALYFRHLDDANNEYIYMSDVHGNSGTFYFVADSPLPANGSVPVANADIKAGRIIKEYGTSAQFLKADGSTSEIYKGDLTNHDIEDQNNSFWVGKMTSATNGTKPPYVYNTVAHFGGDQARAFQLAVGYGGNPEFHFRRKSDNASAPNGANTWQPWYEIYHSGNLTNLSDLNDDLSYVDLSTNQTISGEKTFNNDVRLANNVRLDVGDGRAYLTGSGPHTEFSGIGNITIQADNDLASENEYLDLRAGYNSLKIVGGSLGDKITYNGETIYHAGNLTNVSQLNNDAGYLTPNNSGLAHTNTFIIYGDSDKYYPVLIHGGNQDLIRTIKIWRAYNENPGPDDWNTSTHKGGLGLTWVGNFGGWGGAVYREGIIQLQSQYTQLLADCFRANHSMGYIFMLRGGGVGGAIYHIASDQEIKGYYNNDNVDIFYSDTELTFGTAGSGSEKYAPAPVTTINDYKLDGIQYQTKFIADGYYLKLDGSNGMNANLKLNNNEIEFANDGSSNIDHIYHDEGSNTYHFVSDSPIRSQGNSTLKAGSFVRNGGTGSNVLLDDGNVKALSDFEMEGDYLLRDGSLPMTGDLVIGGAGTTKGINTDGDNKRLILSGGTNYSSANGAYIVINGNDYNGSGDIALVTGNQTSEILFYGSLRKNGGTNNQILLAGGAIKETDTLIQDFGISSLSSVDTVLETSGKYRWNVNSAGRPISGQGNEYGTLLNLDYDGYQSTQIAQDIYSQNLYFRSLNTSTDAGTPWRKIWHDGNHRSDSDNDGRYLRSDASSTLVSSAMIYGGDNKPLLQTSGNAAYLGSTTRDYVTIASINDPRYRDNAGTYHTLYHAGNLNPVTLDTTQTITGEKTFTGRTYLGGQIISSSATLQVDGFMRTGSIFIHSGEHNPDTVRAQDYLTNIDGDLSWSKDGIGKFMIFHEGNLTNVSQLNNDAGYLTGYTETDTLDSVVQRGDTTNTLPKFNAGFATNIDSVQTYYNIASYYNGNTSVGTICITLNDTINGMLDAEISVQGYGGVAKFHVRGYTYTGTGAWHDPEATVLASGRGFTDSVRFAVKTNGDRCILLGNTTHTWGSYTHVNVTRVSNGYGGNNPDWSISLITDESDFTSFVSPIVNDKMIFPEHLKKSGDTMSGNLQINTPANNTVGNGLRINKPGVYYAGFELATNNVVDWSIGSNADGFGIYEAGLAINTRINIKPGGNVGIGTTAPTEKLEVAGNVKATKFLGYLETTPNANSKSLHIGGNDNNNTTTSRGAITVTNGNLHLDSAVGNYHTYINYYAGTAGVRFGNGAGGYNAEVTASGHIYANSFNKSGGTNNQILLADGSIKDVSDFVDLTTTQTISGAKLFTSEQLQLSGHLYRNKYQTTQDVYDHYFPLGEAGTTSANLRVNNASGYKTLRFSGDGSFTWDGKNVLTANGTSSQFLKADGSVDSKGYLEQVDDINIDTKGNYILAKPGGGWLGGSKPAGSHNGFGVISMQLHTGSYYGQWGLSSNDNAAYYRTNNNASWGSWEKLAKDSDIPTNTSDLTNDSNYIRATRVTANTTSHTSVGNNGAFTGMYYSSTSGQDQPPVGNAHIISQSSSSSYTQQIGGRDNRLFFRHQEAGVWGTWKEFATQEWVNAQGFGSATTPTWQQVLDAGSNEVTTGIKVPFVQAGNGDGLELYGDDNDGTSRGANITLGGNVTPHINMTIGDITTNGGQFNVTNRYSTTLGQATFDKMNFKVIPNGDSSIYHEFTNDHYKFIQPGTLDRQTIIKLARIELRGGSGGNHTFIIDQSGSNAPTTMDSSNDVILSAGTGDYTFNTSGILETSVGGGFAGTHYGATSGAPSSTIWAISPDYTTYGIFYEQSTPDKINFKFNNVVKASISLDDGDFTGRKFIVTGKTSDDVLLGDGSTTSLSGISGGGAFNGGVISGKIGRSAHNVGHLEGGYNNIGASSTNTNPIFTIGSSYNPSSTALSDMYGIGYSHNNSSFINTTDLGSHGSGWGLYVAADGNARIFLNGTEGSGHFKGNIYSNSALVATQSWVTTQGYATGDNFDNDGTYASLRAQGTTASDVGLSALTNHTQVRLNDRSDGYVWMRRNSSNSAVYITNQSTGNIIEFRQGASDGSIKSYVANDGTMYAPDFGGYSDRRLKENIVIYKPKAIQSEYAAFNFIGSDNLRYGVIAQELEKAHPEFIRTDKDGIKSVSYQDLHSAEIAYLKSKVKEQQEELEELRRLIKN